MFWSGFQLIPRHVIPDVVKAIDAEMEWLREKQNYAPTAIPYKTYWDDMSLAHFMKGLALRQYAYPFRETIRSDTEVVHRILEPQEKRRLLIAATELEAIIPTANKIAKDHYLLPFARFELAQTYLRLGDFTRANIELRAAARGGALSHESVSPKKCYTGECILLVKVENLQLKVNTLKKLSNWKEERNEDIWAAYESSDTEY